MEKWDAQLATSSSSENNKGDSKGKKCEKY